MSEPVGNFGVMGVIYHQPLSETHPNLADEWLRGPDGDADLRPDQVTPGSYRAPWWRCSNCAHEWPARTCNRTAGKGCPKCAKGRRTSACERQIAAELLTHASWPVDAGDEAEIAGRKRHYKCDVVVSKWRLVVEYDGWYWHGLPGCLRRDAIKTRALEKAAWTVIRIRADLPAITDCDIHTERETPRNAIPHLVAQVIDRAIALGHPAPINGAAYLKRIASEGLADSDYRPPPLKSLAERRPGLVAEWHPTLNGGLQCHQIAAGSSKKAWWICACGHEWVAEINSRTAGRGCPACAKSARKGLETPADARLAIAAMVSDLHKLTDNIGVAPRQHALAQERIAELLAMQISFLD